jgi:hypothetical protein
MAKERVITQTGTLDSGTVLRAAIYNPGVAIPQKYVAIPLFDWLAFGFVRVTNGVTWIGAAFTYVVNVNFLKSGWAGEDASDSNNFTITLPISGATNTETRDWGGGSFVVSCVFEEEESADTTGLFPATFGPSIAHGPKQTTRIFRERTKVGEFFSVEITMGDLSISKSIEITESNAFYLAETGDWGDYGCFQEADVFNWGLVTECGLSSTVDLDGTPIALTCALSGSSAGHSVSGSSAHAIAPGVTGGPSTSHRTIARSEIVPDRSWSLHTYLRAMEDAYPSDVDFRVDRKSDDLNALVVCGVDGTEQDTENQRRFSYSGQFLDATYAPMTVAMNSDGVDSPYSKTWTAAHTQPASDDVDEFQDFTLGVDAGWISDNNEETEDWRGFIQLGASEAIGSLTHETAYVVNLETSPFWEPGDDTTVGDSGGYILITASGGVGSAQFVFTESLREFNPYDDWSAGIDLECVLQYSAAGQDFLLSVDDAEQVKEWEGTIPSANVDTTFTFDLRAPHNASVTTDSTQSRYLEEGWYFGVIRAHYVEFSGIPDGVTLRVKSITIKRRDRSRVNFGLPTRPWLDNGVGSNYLRHVFGESYKVALEVPGMAETGGVYGYPDVTSFFYNIDNFHPGWSAVNSASAEILGLALMWINGIHGAYWNGSAWVSSIDGDARTSLALHFAEGADAIRWYPYMGEMRGAYGEVTPMRVGKVLRGRIGAVVIDNVAHEGASAIDVTFSGGASSSEIVATDAEGLALSSPRKWGSATATVNGNTVTSNLYNRWVMWSGFATVPSTLYRAIEVDSPRAWLHISVENRIRTYHIPSLSLVFESAEYPIDAWHRLRYDRRRGKLFMLGVDGSEFVVFVSEDGGFTGEEVLRVTAQTALLETHSEESKVTLYFENGAEVNRQETDTGNLGDWGSAEVVQYDNSGTLADLIADLLDMAREQRHNGAVYLVATQSGTTKVFRSHDVGKTFEIVLT